MVVYNHYAARLHASVCSVIAFSDMYKVILGMHYSVDNYYNCNLIKCVSGVYYYYEMFIILLILVRGNEPPKLC